MSSLFDMYCIKSGEKSISEDISLGKYFDLDPILREWGCQIRAFLLTKLIKDFLEKNKHKDKLESLIGQVLFIKAKKSHIFSYITNQGKGNDNSFPDSFLTFLVDNKIDANKLSRNLK